MYVLLKGEFEETRFPNYRNYKELHLCSHTILVECLKVILKMEEGLETNKQKERTKLKLQK